MASYAFFETVDFRAGLLVPLFFLAFILLTSEFFTPSLFFLTVLFLEAAFFVVAFFDAAFFGVVFFAAFFDAVLWVAFAIRFQKAITTGVPVYRLSKQLL
jgi:hypothetical protein